MRFTLLSLGLLVACSAPDSTRLSAQPDVAGYVRQLREDVRMHPGSNTELACYVDLTLPDTGYRFFLLDLRQGRILKRGLCLNGKTENGRVLYSNVLNSNCSSRGLARIGSKYSGTFGRAYRLQGLEASTSNLAKRAVVLHGWWGVEAQPVQDMAIESQGCPTLNPAFLDTVSAYIDASRRPLLIRLD